jgi:hypothetical protein
MDAFDFITRIESAGFTLDLADGNLAISPASQLTDSQRQWIRDHRDELVAALRSSESLLDAEGGHDLLPGNDPDCLPPSLAEAATRVCRDHGDDDKAVEAMLDDLRDQPGDWDAITGHFEGQLPALPEPGMERVRMQAAGFEFDLDLPAEHAPGIRKSVRFMLRDGQGGGSVLGKPGQSEAELREILQQKYADRLASINEQPSPVTCRGCRHAEIGLRPPVVICGLGLQATNPAGWLADEPHQCGGFEL